MNFVLLMGRFVADPELKKTTSGKSVCAFTLAVDKGKDRGADFIDTVAWEKTAEFICKYFKKGSPIVIEGAVQTRIKMVKSVKLLKSMRRMRSLSRRTQERTQRGRKQVSAQGLIF